MRSEEEGYWVSEDHGDFQDCTQAADSTVAVVGRVILLEICSPAE